MRYTPRNALLKPDPEEIDFPGSMEANSTILDAAISKRYETATRVPTVTDDASAGYSAGSWWQYTTGPVLYRCTSAVVGAAIWIQVWPNAAVSVTNAMLAGSIADSKLATSYIKADGSRGLSAAWTIAYQIISTLAIGTAPFSVVSTTKVANLNSDLLDGLEATAFASSTTVAMIAHQTTAQTITAGYAENVLICDAEDLDTNNAHNPATGVFTVPVAGEYLCGFFFNFTGLVPASGGDFILYIKQNASALRVGRKGIVSAYDGASGMKLLSCAANDTIRFIVEQGNGASRTLEANMSNYWIMLMK